MGKFDARSDEGILVGYSMHSKAYRVYNKRTKIIEESIHVVFDESNDGKLSSSFNEFKFNSHEDDEDEDDTRGKTNQEGSAKPQELNKENEVSSATIETTDVNEAKATPGALNE